MWEDEVIEAKEILAARRGAQRDLAQFMGVPNQRLTDIFRGRIPLVTRADKFREGIRREKERQAPRRD